MSVSERMPVSACLCVGSRTRELLPVYVHGCACICVCLCVHVSVCVFVSVRVCGLTVLPFFFNRSPGIRHPTSCLLNVTYFTVDHVSG